MEKEIESISKDQCLFITDQCKLFLEEAAKWTKMLSILGFIGVSIMILASIFVGVVFSLVAELKNSLPFSPSVLSITYLIFAAIYIVPTYYLLKFSTNLDRALKLNSPDMLEDSFRFLKSHYKYIGIVAITVILLYIIIIIGSIAFGFLSLI